MDWRDVACIVFACTAMNHLGLIRAIKTVTKCNRLPVVSCPKCLSFWSVLAYGTWHEGLAGLPVTLAASLLCSYTAVWLELIMYAIDTLYNRIYGIIEEENEEDGGNGEG